MLVPDLIEVNLNAEHLVVTHTHQVPSGVVRLAVIRLVPSPAPDLLAPHEVRNVQLVRPPDPAPVHPVICRLLDLVDFADLPVLSAVGRDLDTGDAPSAAGVGIAAHLVRAPDVLGEVDRLAVIGRGHGRVNVELVEDVLGLVPPSSREGLLGGDVRGEDAVVVVVVVVLRLVLEDVDVGEPLDHAAADVAGDDESDREAVVRLEPLPIRLVGDEDIIRWIHRPRQRHARAVLDELPPRLVLERPRADLVRQVLVSDELNVLPRHVTLGHASGDEEVAEQDALPHVRGDAASAPVEPDRLADHVLLLPSVAGADEGDGELAVGHGLDFVHAQVEGARHDAAHADAVGLPGEVGTGAVIPHVVEAGGRDELVLLVDEERRLDVEGMASREADQLPVAGDPLVRRPDVAVVGEGLHVPHRLGLRDDVGRRGAAVLVRHGHRHRGGVRPVELGAGVLLLDERLVALEIRDGRRRLYESRQVDGRLRDGSLRSDEHHGCLSSMLHSFDDVLSLSACDWIYQCFPRKECLEWVSW
mmetsp:Transcript_32498/g.77627  ORF Transcript_32498/g.77627 Transcript_32498/m.77627 type:complete len:530 (+) Transcript_32498:1316-2905(+)